MRIQKSILFLFCNLLFCGVFALAGYGDSSETRGDFSNSTENQFTPIVVSLLTEPHPVLGSDDRYHLIYELQLTNPVPLPWQINSIEVLNGGHPDQLLAEFSGDTVAEKNEILPTRESGNTLEGGQTSVFFITFTVDSLDDIPESIIHRLKITVPGGIPAAFLSFLSLPPDTTEIVLIEGSSAVSQQQAVVIGPPLLGTKWIGADGCCTAARHTHAFLPINGKLVISQRFAADWEKLNDQNRVYVGDSLDVTSYFAYGQGVFAVGNGRVVIAVDKYDDQIPGELPPGIPLDEADGNYIVLDLGSGNFAFYAHLIKGSLTVETGDSVTRGQLIGLLGNTGNSSAPHLHFHMMSGPSTFGSNGIPFVINEYNLIGQAPSTEAFDEAEINGTPLEIIPVDIPGVHMDDLPLDLSIVKFWNGSKIGIFRPGSGLWAIKGITRTYFGRSNDIPIYKDFDGDGMDDLTIFRPDSGLWAVKGITRVYFGGSNDNPAAADYNGNGTTDIAIFRPDSGLWAVKNVTRVHFGSSEDEAVPGDYSGDGTDGIGIFRPSSGLWALKDVSSTFFGGFGDNPVPGNYGGDGTLDIGIFRPATGLWQIKEVTRSYFGRLNDEPVPGDYDGSGTEDIGIFRDTSGLWAIRKITRCYFGEPGDIPLAR